MVRWKSLESLPGHWVGPNETKWIGKAEISPPFNFHHQAPITRWQWLGRVDFSLKPYPPMAQAFLPPCSMLGSMMTSRRSNQTKHIEMRIITVSWICIIFVFVTPFLEQALRNNYVLYFALAIIWEQAHLYFQSNQVEMKFTYYAVSLKKVVHHRSCLLNMQL